MEKTHCPFCGDPYLYVNGKLPPFPRKCPNDDCQKEVWENPVPVAVTIVPLEGPLGGPGHIIPCGVLCVRRSIPPKIGELCLPGGFIVKGEGWRQGAVREVYEETGVRLDPAELKVIDVLDSPTNPNVVLIFCQSEFRTAAVLPPFVPNDEASARYMIRQPTKLAFPLHEQVVAPLWALHRWPEWGEPIEV